jgi:hypothetical protein
MSDIWASKSLVPTVDRQQNDHRHRERIFVSILYKNALLVILVILQNKIITCLGLCLDNVLMGEIPEIS